MNRKSLSRRDFLRAGSVAAAAAALAGCGPAPTPQVIKETQIIKETQVVKETQIVKETVKETVQVQVAAPTTEPITLTLWHHWGGDREPLLKKAGDDFSARNPGVSVEMTLIPWERKEETVLTAMAAGNAPDVLHLIATETPVYVSDNALVALDEYITKAGIKPEEYLDVDWQGGIVNGKVWALPLNSAGADHMLFYNKNHFKEAGLDPEVPPKTWAEVKTFAQKLTKKEGKDITRLGVQLPTSGWEWLYYIAQNDGEWLSKDGKQILMDNEKSVEALQYVVDVYDIQGGFEKVSGFLTIARQTEPFIAEAVSVYASGQWVNYYILTGNPKLPYGTGLAPNNQGPWNAESYGPQQWTIPAGNKHNDQAFALSLWLSRGDGGCKFLAPQIMPSAWTDCNKSNAYPLVASFWPTIEAAFKTTRPSPPTPVFGQFLTFWDEMFQKALMHQSTAAEAVKSAVEQMDAANKEYWAKHG